MAGGPHALDAHLALVNTAFDVEQLAVSLGRLGQRLRVGSASGEYASDATLHIVPKPRGGWSGQPNGNIPLIGPVDRAEVMLISIIEHLGPGPSRRSPTSGKAERGA